MASLSDDVHACTQHAKCDVIISLQIDTHGKMTLFEVKRSGSMRAPRLHSFNEIIEKRKDNLNVVKLNQKLSDI